MAKKRIGEEYALAKIKVVGVGGAGTNAISRMIESFPRGVDLIAINTDIQDLGTAKAKKRIQIGKNVTRGLGTGMNPDLGRQAAEESRSEISDALQGADMVFITAGLGGGTGTGGAPVVAEIAKELGILSIATVTKPFGFEGAKRIQIAEEGLIRLRDRVDTLITIPNDRIFSLIDKDTSLIKAFEAIDEVLKNSVLGITELIATPGTINIDFADIKSIIQDGGSAIIGIGIANGPDRSVAAANSAINSPLLEISIDGARGVLFSIAGHRDLKMNEVNEIAKLISENIDPSAKIIFGTHYDRKLRKGQIKVTLVATGFNGVLNKNNTFPSLFSQPTSAKRTLEVKKDESENPSKIIHSIPTITPTITEAKGLNRAQKESILFEKKREGHEKLSKDEEGGEVWDIPAFLRKKKKRRH